MATEVTTEMQEKVARWAGFAQGVEVWRGEIMEAQEITRRLSIHKIQDPLFSHRYCYQAGYQDALKEGEDE